MRRLNIQNQLNSSEAFDKIFKEKKPNEMDIRRWQELFKYYKGGHFIDLGCLWSYIPLWAKRRYPGFEIWAMDQAEEAIREMAEAEPSINYTVGDVYETLFPNEYFDYAVAGELIEHLERPHDFIKEVFRILKPGGKLALSTPKNEKKGEVDEHRHLWSFTASDIRDLCRPYMRGAKIYEIPSWIERRMKYHHPYLICIITKKK